MSRIGKKPVAIPKSVKVAADKRERLIEIPTTQSMIVKLP